MGRGELIGKGMTAEVYEWGHDRVLKLYLDKFSLDWISYEAVVGTIVHGAGIPSPDVYDMIEIDGRKGIIFERIYGKTMLKHIEAEPWKLYYFAQQLARLQFKIHQYTAKGLPSQRDRFEVRIKGSDKILDSKVRKIMDYIDNLPGGSSVCHGDFHFNNIIVSGSELIPIDWAGAYQGNPMGDVARTCLMMRSPSKPPEISDLVAAMSQGVKWFTHWTYLNEYVKLAKVKFEDIDVWILPAAAAKLIDGMPGEEEWLMGIINSRLKKLNMYGE